MSRYAYQPLQIYVFCGKKIMKPLKNTKKNFFVENMRYFLFKKSHKSGEVDRLICSSPKSGEVDRHFCLSYSRWADMPLLRISL